MINSCKQIKVWHLTSTQTEALILGPVDPMLMKLDWTVPCLVFLYKKLYLFSRSAGLLPPHTFITQYQLHMESLINLLLR